MKRTTSIEHKIQHQIQSTTQHIKDQNRIERSDGELCLRTSSSCVWRVQFFVIFCPFLGRPNVNQCDQFCAPPFYRPYGHRFRHGVDDASVIRAPQSRQDNPIYSSSWMLGIVVGVFVWLCACVQECEKNPWMDVKRETPYIHSTKSKTPSQRMSRKEDRIEETRSWTTRRERHNTTPPTPFLPPRQCLQSVHYPFTNGYPSNPNIAYKYECFTGRDEMNCVCVYANPFKDRRML